MLESASIIEWEVPKETVGKLVQGVATKRHAEKPTERAYKMDKISIEPSIRSYLSILAENYPFEVRPYTEEEQTTQFEKDIIFRLYNFYPEELLIELGMPDEKERKMISMLQKVDVINEYAYNK